MADRNKSQVTSAFDLFGKSYEVVMRNIKNFGILLALPFIGSLVSTFNWTSSKQAHNKWMDINPFSSTMPAYSIIGIVSLGLIVFIALAIAALIIQAMLTGLELEGSEGKTPSLSHLWEIGKKYWLRLFGLFLVIGMYMIVPVLIGLGLALIFHNVVGILIGIVLIGASVLFVLRHYFLASYALIDKDLPILSAMEFSNKISKDHTGAIFSVIGVSALLSLSGVVPILGPLISFALGAFYSVAPALRYQELKRLS